MNLSACRYLVGVLALVSVGSAKAHSFREGGTYDQFVQGVAVPLSAPESLLLLLSTGAMIGLWPGGGVGRMLPFMATGGLVGLLVGTLMPVPMSPSSISWLLLSFSIGVAVLAIGSLAWPWWLTGITSFVATGLCAGYAFIDHARGEVPMATLGGSLFGSLLCIILVHNVIALACERWTHAWIPIGLRVASSWLCAIAILMLAFTLRL